MYSAATPSPTIYILPPIPEIIYTRQRLALQVDDGVDLRGVCERTLAHCEQTVRLAAHATAYLRGV